MPKTNCEERDSSELKAKIMSTVVREADSQIKSHPAEPPGTGLQRARLGRWQRLWGAFSATHQRPLNVALHTLTTPLCFFGLLSVLAHYSDGAAIGFSSIYAVAMIPFVPRLIALTSTFTLAGLTAAAMLTDPGWLIGGACLAVGYVGQEAAHWVTREKTLQSTYMGSRGWLGNLADHTFYLLPLVMATSPRGHRIWFAPFVSRLAVLKAHLESADQRKDLESIRQWVDRDLTEVTQSVHFWQNELQGEAGSAFMRLSECEALMDRLREFHGPAFAAEPVYGMNELYVTGPVKKMTSDTVFYIPHVDGPWSVFPFATVYRCMLAASPNDRVHTHFPMSDVQYDPAPSHLLSTGDALSFDFNRELHYITRKEGVLPPCTRVNLKLHFVTYPKWLRPYGRLLARLTTWYDIKARSLFLETIKPITMWEKFKAFQVLASTRGFEWAARFVGWTNLSYLAFIAVVSAVLGSWTVFVAATSFVHYLIYMGTLEEREPISFGNFVRDAVFFKTTAMVTLASLAIAHFDPNPLSWGLIVVGFGMAAWSAMVLGRARTYYGEELGFLEPLRIRKGPYKFLPHPMILGAAIGLVGLLLSGPLRTAYPWLVPLHLGFYALVLFQELAFRHRFPAGAGQAAGYDQPFKKDKQ